MTSEEDPTTGPDETQVRRLLAALGNEPLPMPPEVAARLDATLADLAAERDRAAEAEQTVTPLPTRERRRWPQVLVAAAAVSVLGLGVGEVLEGSTGADSMNAATVQDAERPEVAAGGATEDQAEAAPEPYAAEDPGTEAAEPPADRKRLNRRSALNHAPAALSRLRSRTLAADVQRIADFTVTDTAVQGAPLAAARDGLGCELPAPAGGELYVVRLDGAPATLLLHAAEDGRRIAEVFACDDASEPVASTTVDAG